MADEDDMSAYPCLDVKKILRPILKNYDRHVLRFIGILKKISCELVYEGPLDLHDHVRDKTVYACSVRYYNNNNTTGDGGEQQRKKKFKLLKCVFPVMIGSDLDFCIRNLGHRTFSDLRSKSRFLERGDDCRFHPADIAASFFLINGCVKQLPYSFTNDPTNTHVVRGGKVVRCYTYDANDRGKELSYYVRPNGRYRRGDCVVVLNDGSAVAGADADFFRDSCPHRTDQKAYMARVFEKGRFDIDHLGNKIFVSPGHLFVKLFAKYLYRPLEAGLWDLAKSKHAMVVKSIETGTLLHVLSKKTIYFKENAASSAITVVNNNNARSQTEGGRSASGGGDVYVEKNSGCYREVNMQTYPLNPYLSHLMTRQVSNKVKKSNVAAFHPSHVGFFCLVGTFETKNVGRICSMVRNTVVSTRDDVGRVYDLLDLEPLSPSSSCDRHYVVINEACIPVTRECFRSVNLERLKSRLRFVECYRDGRFVLVRYKIGLFYKRLTLLHPVRIDDERRCMQTVWVTARDEAYWRRDVRPAVFGELTGHLADLNPYFRHNVFTKNILAFNTLKNAVLATSRRYSEYFMESLSAYSRPSPRHRTVCRPVDRFSSRFALRVPLLTVGYASYRGLNQEDCIVVDRRLRAFDCVRFYTVRIRFETPSRRFVRFVPLRGDPGGRLLGHLVCHDPDCDDFRAVSLTLHARLERFRPNAYRVYFDKPGVSVVSFDLSEDRLAVCATRRHRSQTGDKLSSFHGQKGVIRTARRGVPVFERKGGRWRVTPDMLVDPFCFFRITVGQLREALDRGGRDYRVVWNRVGRRWRRRKTACGRYGAFVGDTLYFSVTYLANEHIYAPVQNAYDKINNQPLKGRSRYGGMKIGNMENMNGLRGNGLAACYEEKVNEHSDRMFYPRSGERKRRRIDEKADGCKKRRRSTTDGVPKEKKKKRKWSSEPPVEMKRRRLYQIPSRVNGSTVMCTEEMKMYRTEVHMYVKPHFEEVS